MILKGKTKEQVEAEKLSQAKSVAVSAINAHKEVLFKRGFSFDGEQYPLDLGAQVAYQALQNAITLGIQLSVFVITVDNKTIMMDADTFGLFALQAFKNASDIVLQARKIKDKILAETDIDIIKSMQEAFCK
jgi:hypothetical protein